MGQLIARLGSPRKITKKTGGRRAEFSISARSSATLFRHCSLAERGQGGRTSHGHGGQISRAGGRDRTGGTHFVRTSRWLISAAHVVRPGLDYLPAISEQL